MDQSRASRTMDQSRASRTMDQSRASRTMDQSRASRMRAILERAFAPAQVSVDDESARHAGHAGASDAGETHYNVAIVSPAFATISRVARSRAVHDALAGEFATGLHALSLKLRTPEEAPPPNA